MSNSEMECVGHTSLRRNGNERLDEVDFLRYPVLSIRAIDTCYREEVIERASRMNFQSASQG